VVPVSLTKDWNVIVRTIVPIVNQTVPLFTNLWSASLVPSAAFAGTEQYDASKESSKKGKE
jgi:hypothetical protein